GPAVFDRRIPIFDVTGFAQALAERGRHGAVPAGRFATEEPDHRHRLLRTRYERPRGRAAEQRDEFATFHCPMPPVLRTETTGDCWGFRPGQCQLRVRT